MVVKTGLLKRPPLLMVLAAVRFQSVELLPKWIPEIQDGLRDSLPVFSRYQQKLTPQGTSFEIDGPDFDPADPQSAWLFTRSDHKLTVQLSREALIVHTKDYTTFGDFLVEIKAVLAVLMPRVRHLDVNFAGVRYLDHLRPLNDHSLDQYIPPQLLPLSSWNPDAELVGGLSVHSYTMGEDRLQARLWTGSEYNLIPDDLMPVFMTGLDLKTLLQGGAGLPIAKLERGAGVLDVDCFCNFSASTRSDTASLAGVLDRLHVKANGYFRSVCTDVAFNDWQE